MKVHHFIAPAPVGGAESVVLALAGGFAQRGHAVRVSPVVPADPESHPFVQSLRAAGVEVDPLVVGDRAYVREWREVGRILRARRPDVVHTHGHRSDLLDGSVALAEGIPTVATVHGFTGSSWRTRIYRYLQRRAYRRFDAVVAVSRPLADQLVDSGGPGDRVHRLSNAWDGDGGFLDPLEARRRLGVAEDAFHLGWVGRLGHEKGADVLLRAMARLGDAPVVASVVGDGGEAGDLQELAERLDLGDRVRWHGQVPRARRLFPAFDAFILSSRREGTPVVLLEAMAAGVPIVATRVGGVPDVVSSSEAFLVPPEDPEALASAVRRILRAPEEAARRARGARRRLEEERDPESWLEEHERIYRGVLAGEPHNRSEEFVGRGEGVVGRCEVASDRSPRASDRTEPTPDRNPSVRTSRRESA